MPSYTFTFPAAAAGLTVTVRNAAGSTVDTGTVGAASGAQGSASYSVSLAVGAYVAEAADAKTYFSSRANGVLNTIQASIAGWVDPTSPTFAADLITALVAAGLMAAE